jgi:formylglycine-generating enzyme required for sulfatase activity
MKLFISYSRVDRPFAQRIVARLRVVYGYDAVWFDEELRGGDKWWEEILTQIAASDILLYLLSNESVTSPFCQAEFTEAQRLRKLIITVQVRDRTALTDTLDGIQFVDMKAGPDDVEANALLNAAINKQRDRIPQRPPKPLWPQRTPRPGIIEVPTIAERADVETPALTRPTPPALLPSVERKAKPMSRFRWVIGFITLATLLGLGGLLLSRLLIIPTSPTDTPAKTAVAEDVTPTATHSPVDTRAPSVQPSTPAVTQPLIATTSPSDTPAQTPTATFTFTDTPDHQRTTATASAETAQAETTITNAFTDTPSAIPTDAPTLTITARIIATVTTNREWVPQILSVDGVEMVLVPPGCFIMGSENNWDNQKPAHQVCFRKAFYIDRFEVTNGQFAAFSGTAARTSRWSAANRPRERITWLEARAFCEKRAARLPSEAEWEYAGRGPDANINPWPGGFVVANVVTASNADRQTADVGADQRVAGQSWVGAYDLLGNVSEWTRSVYNQLWFRYPYDASDGRESTDAYPLRVYRGGSWTDGYTPLSARFSVSPDSESSNIGFRCVRSFD